MKIFITDSMQKRLNLKNTENYTFTNNLDEDVKVLVGFESTAGKHLKKLPNLKYILLTTAGFAAVDMKYVREKQITLTNAKGVFSIPIAESILSNILAFNRKHILYYQQQTKSQWIRHDDLIELSGSHIGFLGGGSIAEATLEVFKGFNVTSSVYRKSHVLGPFDKVYTDYEGLKKMFKKSDYIINTLPLNDHTKNLVTKELLSLCKKDLFYVNVGRGQTNDEEALIEALRMGKIRGAYLDVFQEEPLVGSLYREQNLIITPHNSQSSTKNSDRLHKLIKQNIENILNNKPLINVVND